MMNRKRRQRNRRRLRAEKLENRVVLSANPLVCDVSGSGLHTIPFEVDGGGPAPEGLPLFGGGTAPHFATGSATRLGQYSGSAILEFGGFTDDDPNTGTGTFSSDEPFVFTAPGGDQITFNYGREDLGADGPGTFTIMPQLSGDVVVEFVAEFTLDPSQSTGRFAKYTEGSFVMVATTEAFSTQGDILGYTEAFDYTWVGNGSISFPTGTTYEVTNKSDHGTGSLREAIEHANLSEGIDTIGFAKNVRGKIALDDELTITDDVTICGPGAQRLAVSGEHETRVFTVDPVEPHLFGVPDGERIAVEIHDLAIADGLATDAPGLPTEAPFSLPAFGFGGGIYNRGSDLALESVSMRGNQAGSDASPLAAGGAIANEFGGTVTIGHSTFERNVAVARHVGAGGAITQDVGPTIDGLGTKSPAMVITDSSFSRNTARAIETNPIAALDFAPFAGFGMGGAIFSLAGDLDVEHSSFSRNQAVGGDGVGGNLGGAAVGGAIFSDDFSPFIDDILPGRDANFRINDSSFVRNSAQGGNGDGEAPGGTGHGGAVGASISFFPDAGSVTDSVLTRNTAAGGDGGSEGGDGGGGIGGGIAALAGASVDVHHAMFVRNTALGGNGGNGHHGHHGHHGHGHGDGGEGRGGAIGLALLKTSIETPFEGAPFIPSVDVTHSEMIRNQALGGAGGKRGGAGGDGHGGGIGLDDGALASVANSLLLHNSATGGRGGQHGGDGGDGQGGGIFNGDSIITVTGSAVVRNSARGGKGHGKGHGKGKGKGHGHREDGLGQGGGLYNSESGKFNIDEESFARTRLNVLDDVFGDLTFLV